MDVGSVFTPKGMQTNIDVVEDFYGSKGYIDVTTGSRNLNVARIPNTESGTMDLDFQIDEGRQYSIEKIEIKGNVKTKDKVIRRELAVSPGETFDMLRVKISKQRLEGLQYFEKVDTRAENTDVQGGKNLVVGVDEKNTGNLTVGAGFSSIDSLVGFAEVSQANFDLFHPPTFTGGGPRNSACECNWVRNVRITCFRSSSPGSLATSWHWAWIFIIGTLTSRAWTTSTTKSAGAVK
jgi:outer membrane protein insertion porin family